MDEKLVKFIVILWALKNGIVKSKTNRNAPQMSLGVYLIRTFVDEIL